MVTLREIPGFEGLYSASDDGRVYSSRTQRYLRAASQGEYLIVTLSVKGRRTTMSVHRAVLLAHRGLPPEGKPWGLHGNGDPMDNRICNLRWGSAEENAQDKQDHGRNYYATRDSCGRGHRYTDETVNTTQGGRQCKVCAKLRSETYKRDGLPPYDDRHGTYNGYTHFRCRCVSCKAAGSRYNRLKSLERRGTV